MGLFGGGSSGSTKVTTQRYIPPPTSYESSLLDTLYNTALTGVNDYYQPGSRVLSELQTPYAPSTSTMDLLTKPFDFSSDIYETLKSPISLPEGYHPSEEFTEAMKDPYVSMLPFQEKVGSALNDLAAKGVVNSSITQNAMNQLGRWATERGQELKTQGLMALEAARQQEALDALKRAQYESEYNLRRSGLLAELEKAAEAETIKNALLSEQLNQASSADALKRALLEEDLSRISQASQNEQLDRLFNLWSVLYQGRMGTPTTVTSYSNPNSGLLSQMLGTATGLGLGYLLGPAGGFGAIASGLGGLFSGVGSGILNWLFPQKSIALPTEWA